MIQNHRPLRFLHLAVAAATLLALSACATGPKEGALVVGQQATIEGDVVSVDTKPWAYDGNAVVTISTINAGMVSGLLPVVGVPLPLVSYGGTSMVTLLASFGILMSLYSHRKLVAS
jgi:hypothetical protein